MTTVQAAPTMSATPDTPTTQSAQDTWELAGLTLRSRLLVGTARYPSVQVMLDAVEASGAEMVTVALRRVGLPGAQANGGPTPAGHTGGAAATGSEPENLYQLLAKRNYHILPNTAGCFTVKDAVLTAQLGREALGTSRVKLELIADDETQLPDVVQLLEAARTLVRDGFSVLPYTNDDPVTAQKLADVGCAAVMPLGAPIGSGLGIRNPHNIELMRRRLSVPLIVDAGVGTASDVAIAFELGCDGVLLNSAIARAHDPVRMAAAMRHAALAGRDALLAGRMPRRTLADPTSPMAGRVLTKVG